MLSYFNCMMNKTILIADDSNSLRQMVSMTLSQAGYQVIEAEHGRDAVAKAVGKSVHLFITDLNMPLMNGIELIRTLRADPAHKFTPMLMLTTESDTTKKTAGRAAGATGWILKPFNPDQLLAVIKKVLP